MPPIKRGKGRPPRVPDEATGSDDYHPNSKSKYMGTQSALMEISAQLGRTYRALDENAGSTQAELVTEEINREIALMVARIKHKALKQFEVMLDCPMPPAVRLGYLRFAIGNDLENGTGPRPEQLIFETMISETGTVEQQQRKVFTRTTVNKGAGHERKDDEPLF